MAEIEAFRAYRYDLAKVGMLRQVTAPPYDVISPEHQQQLYDRSPFNVIRLILNKEEPSDNEQSNRYTRAAGFLRTWMQDEIIVQDSARGLYVYHQEFEVEGKRYIRRGFFARVRLEPLEKGQIFAHENTMPGPKADRLKLMHATAMNLSAIFAMYPDDTREVQSMLDDAVGQALPLEATDDNRVISRLWPVTNTQVVSAVTGMMGTKPIFIADGHHRYETALKYLEQKLQAGEAQDPNAPARFIMMMLVGMSDPGLIVLPTHRLVSNIGNNSAEQMLSILEPHFECNIVGKSETAARRAWEELEANPGAPMLAFGTAVDDTWFTARLKSLDVMDHLAPEHSPAWRSLPVSILHQLVLGKLLPDAGRPEPKCSYVHRLDEVIANKEYQLAALVPPATMNDVERIAGNREKMPAKSTYFYPKLLSGLLLHSLKSN